MALVFKTDSEDPNTVEIAGVGLLPANGKGGVAVEFAAPRMRELQDDNGEPLSGADLGKAAREFAKSRGFTVQDIKAEDATAEALWQEAGGPPPLPDRAEESKRLYQQFYEPIPEEPVNVGTEQTVSSPTAGATTAQPPEPPEGNPEDRTTRRGTTDKTKEAK
jgi:hypothetical protein